MPVPTSGPRRYITVKEFRAQGYLQELNRQFLHPLGLALEVIRDDNGTERLGGIWDARDDPEGIRFGPGTIDTDKLDHVCRAAFDRLEPRTRALGWWLQPPDDPPASELEDGPDLDDAIARAERYGEPIPGATDPE